MSVFARFAGTMLSGPQHPNRAAASDVRTYGEYLGYVLNTGHGTTPLPHPRHDVGRKYPFLSYGARVRVPMVVAEFCLRGNVVGPYTFQSPHSEFITFFCVTPKTRHEAAEWRPAHSNGARQTVRPTYGMWSARPNVLIAIKLTAGSACWQKLKRKTLLAGKK